ncbi:MAG TPA: hypothetical protein VIA18_01875 [Polyangia bacterium]|jgi:hypothetical protein|nr:hypothetical protein [Polyangia bacterium]
MLKAATLLSMLIAAPAFAAADSAGLQASRATAPMTTMTTRSPRSGDRAARVAEAAAWNTLIRGLTRSTGPALMNPERSLAALATPDLAGEVTHALQSR